MTLLELSTLELDRLPLYLFLNVSKTPFSLFHLSFTQSMQEEYVNEILGEITIDLGFHFKNFIHT